MRVASVEWRSEELASLMGPTSLLALMQARLDKAQQEGVELLVFPGFTGVLYQLLLSKSKSLQELAIRLKGAGDLERAFLAELGELTQASRMAVCIGSCWVKENDEIYHASAVINHGQTLLLQKQIYLARFERELGLARGEEQGLIDICGSKVGIIVGTDVFYPQVARSLVMMGAEVVLVPVGFLGKRNFWLQLSGLWKDVQQNQFFAIESAFNGNLGAQAFWGESAIHAPVEMTEERDGFLQRTHGQAGLIFADLDNAKRKWAISQFDVLRELNLEFYHRTGLFEVRT